MARIIVNDFPVGPARGGRDSAPTPAAQIAMVPREFAANDTTLRFSRRCTGGGPPPRTSPARNLPRTFEFAGAEQANGPASPPGAARTCRKGEFPVGRRRAVSPMFRWR
jgi:hypothetical protein